MTQIKLDYDKIKKLNSLGYNTVYISKQLKCSQTAVERAEKKMGLKTNPTGIRITITWKQIKKIVELYDKKHFTAKEIINRINLKCTENTIIKIVKMYGSGKIRPRGYKHAKVDEDYFKVIDSADKAYILGWIFTDGNIRNKGRNHCLNIELHNNDEYILKYIKKSMKWEGNIHRRSNRKHSYMSINSKTICNDLEQRGLTERKTWESSPHIKNIPEKYQKDYVRGMIDGDGSISKTGNISFVGNEFALKEFCEYVEKITGTKYIPKCKNIERNIPWYIYIRKKDSIKLYNELYYDGCPNLKRKWDRITKLTPC